MSIRWLNFQSFQNSQELISSINSLLIHIKLTDAGLADEGRSEKAHTARDHILSFIDSFQPVIAEEKSSTKTPTLGKDTRFRQLAKSFLLASDDHLHFNSLLFQNDFASFKDLLSSNDNQESKLLIASLEELRTLIEEHLYEDSKQVLGEV